MTDAQNKLQPNVWHAPQNAQSVALKGLHLVAPSPEQTAELKAADADCLDRAKAYETPITDETLRQKVS